VTAVPFALTLLAAVLHASWNFLVKTSHDRLVGGAAGVVVGAVAFSPVLLWTGLPDAAVWPNLLVSGVVHLLYVLALVAGYERADLSVVYPLARGLAPLPIAIGGVVLLGDHLGIGAAAGIGLASLGLVAIGVTAGRVAGTGWAVVTGLLVSVYTLVDAAAVREASNTVAYVVGVFVLNAALLVPVLAVRRARRDIQDTVRDAPVGYLLTGIFSFVAYALVLAAARLAPVGEVSAVRETSIVMGVVAGWLILDEPFGARRVAAAAVVASGVVLLSLA